MIQEIHMAYLSCSHLIQSIPVAKHNWQQKLASYYKPFIVTLPAPFVDKLITPSFAIIAVAAFCGHT
jgi:hypothetical protein